MLSTRNKIPGTIVSIVSDKVVSEIVVQTAVGEIASVITTASVNALSLKEGDSVFVLVKATEAGIQKAD
jgi:molybdate transport system regulatory protein